jgi:uncharacterized protein (TIGR02268 family)
VRAALLRRVMVLTVLVSAVAWAGPGPVAARVLKSRQVVLREGPAESAELRVHPDFPTTLLFESELVPGAVAVEQPERVRLLGAEGRVVVLEPLRELADGERVRLWVTFTRGGTARRAVLALVPHPSEVDAQVRVALPGELAPQGGAAEPREQPELMKLLLSGAVGLGEKLSGTALPATLFPEGVEAKAPWLYRLGEQTVLAIPLRNPEGAAPWEPRVVWLRSESLGPKPVALSAQMRVPRLMPGESGWVIMEWPLGTETGAFRLELREGEVGRGVRLVRRGH